MVSNGKMKNKYLYARFERFWHWLQTLLIIALLLTGFEANVIIIVRRSKSPPCKLCY